jgi:HK97 family phage prohead protease
MQKNHNLELKFSSFKPEDVTINGCRIQGYSSVFDVIDSHNDIIKRGAFFESINKHNIEKKVKLLWQHNHSEPIGVIEELYEDDKGLFMIASINNLTQRGKEIISLISQNAINGLSIGFKVEDFEYNCDGIRVIKKIDLWEVSVVTFPANEQAQINSLSKSKDNSFSKLEKAVNHTLTIISEINQTLNIK